MAQAVSPPVPLLMPPVAPIQLPRNLRTQSIPEFIDKAAQLITLKFLMFPERQVVDPSGSTRVRTIPGISQDESATIIQEEGRKKGESFVDYAKRIYLSAPERQGLSFSLQDRVRLAAFSMLLSSGALHVVLRSVLSNAIDQLIADPNRVLENLFEVVDEAFKGYRRDLRESVTIPPTGLVGGTGGQERAGAPGTVKKDLYEQFVEAAIDSLLPKRVECFTTLKGSQNRVKRDGGKVLDCTIGFLFNKALHYGGRRYQVHIVNAARQSLTGQSLAQIVESDSVADLVLPLIQQRIPAIRSIVELRFSQEETPSSAAAASPMPTGETFAIQFPEVKKRIRGILGNGTWLLNLEAVAAKRKQEKGATRVREEEAGILTDKLALAAERAADPIFNLIYPQLVGLFSEASLARHLDGASGALFGHTQTSEQIEQQKERVVRSAAELRRAIADIAPSVATYVARQGIFKAAQTLDTHTTWMHPLFKKVAVVGVGLAALVTFPVSVGVTTVAGGVALATGAVGGLAVGTTAAVQRAGYEILVSPLSEGAPRLVTSESLLQRLLEGFLRSYTGLPVADAD